MTQSDLAVRLHMTDKAVSRWERGIGFPDIGTLEPLAQALDVTVLELMQGERGSSAHTASQAISDAVALAQQSRAVERYNALAGILCIGMALISLAVLGLSALPEILVCFGALAAILIATGYLKRHPAKEIASICKAVIAISLGLSAGALVLLLPGIVTERYGAMIILLCNGVLFFHSARQLLDAVQNRRTLGRGRLTALLLLNLTVLLLIGFSLKTQVTRMADTAIQERVTVVRQYADTLVMGQFDLVREDLTGQVFTYSTPTGKYPDVFYAAYQFPDEQGDEITYGYRFTLDHNLEIAVTEEGEALGHSILSETHHSGEVS